MAELLAKFRYVIFAMSLLPLSSCASLLYSAKPIQAWVIDAETGKPLEGVIVTANWQLEGGIEGGNPVGQVMIMETVTDKNGRFYFPGWGPKLRSMEGKLKTESPQILMFKSGYSYVALSNKLTMEALRGELEYPLRSDWDGKKVRMERFKGALDEYAQNIYDLSSNIDSVIDLSKGAKDCYWKQIPRMLVALNNMSLSFEAQGVKLKGWRGGQRITRIEDIPSDSHCGSSVQEFFRSYLQ